MTTIKVAIAGPRGRMGSQAIQAIAPHSDMEIVALLDSKHNGMHFQDGEFTSTGDGIPVFTSIEELITETKPDVLLELTVPSTVYSHTATAISKGVRPVVGTSGLSESDLDQLRLLVEETKTGCIIAPNFSIGAVLMMKFSAMAAKYLDDIEIIEKHHTGKVDAPSGTALKTAQMIAEVRKEHTQGHPDEKLHIEGARGADYEGMKIHSVRLPGLLAHQEVIMGGQGELLTLRHDSFDRSSFMPGIIMAIQRVMKEEQLIYGLEHLLD